MPIATRYVCGKKYQVKEAFAGKKFKCKDCDATVLVPEQEVDDLDDYDDDDLDDLEDADDDLPRRSAPKRKSKPQKSTALSKGSRTSTSDVLASVLMVPGIIVGVIGVIVGSVLVLMSAIQLLKGQVGFVAFSFVFSALSLWGGWAAMGKGLQYSTGEPWKGGWSILVGMLMVFLVIGPFIGVAIMAQRQNAQPVNAAPAFPGFPNRPGFR